MVDYKLDIPQMNFNMRNYNFGNTFNAASFNVFPALSKPNFSIFNNATVQTNRTAKEETFEEYRARVEKEEEQNRKEAQEAARKKRDAEEKAEMEKPLTDDEKKVLQNKTLKLLAENKKNAEAGLGASLLFASPFALTSLKPAIKPSQSTLDMFYKQGASHMDLFDKNPDLMTNAQKTMQKLEHKYAKDLKAAKGNQALINKITAERNTFRTVMQKALDNNNQTAIADATARCQTAASVKNGWFKRFVRGFRKPDKFVSRLDAVKTAATNGQFKSVVPPKEGTSLMRNMCTSKLSMTMTAGMIALPVIMDWGNIKQARAIDKQNKEKGVESHYGRKQIEQTAIKSAAGMIAYNLADAGAKTLLKKGLGKIAGKIAAKGAGKLLGTAIGSCIPGIGTVVGLIAGVAIDWALNKFVFGKMEFFNNTGVEEAKVKTASDKQLLSDLGNLYMQGAKLDESAMGILRRKYGREQFNELNRVHNMSESDRNTYFAQLQAQQQALAEQQAALQQVPQVPAA